jgi:hypothetical protein
MDFFFEFDKGKQKVVLYIYEKKKYNGEKKEKEKKSDFQLLFVIYIRGETGIIVFHLFR